MNCEGKVSTNQSGKKGIVWIGLMISSLQISWQKKNCSLKKLNLHFFNSGFRNFFFKWAEKNFATSRVNLCMYKLTAESEQYCWIPILINQMTLEVVIKKWNFSNKWTNNWDCWQIIVYGASCTYKLRITFFCDLALFIFALLPPPVNYTKNM